MLIEAPISISRRKEQASQMLALKILRKPLSEASDANLSVQVISNPLKVLEVS